MNSKMHLELKSTIGENGRMIIPSKIRKLLDLSSGDQVVFVYDNNELKLQPLKSAVVKFQELIKKHNKAKISLVDSLISSRRKESENE